MYVEYGPDADIQKARLAAKAIGMVIVGSTMVVAGLTLLDTLLTEGNQ